MELFDAHCHLQLPQYEKDLAEVLARMQERNMGAVVVGTDLETSRAGIALAEKHDFLWASVGLHPNDPSKDLGRATPLHFDISKYEDLARHPRVVAIGECGLDYFRSGGTLEERTVPSAAAERARQKERFEKQIALALKIKKPLIIHCRDSQQRTANTKSAHDDMLEILFSYSAELENKKVSVIIHFFTGSGELAQKYVNLGCYLSFPGPITYTDVYDESIRVCPLERMLVETDAPFAAPVPYRGKRNEPVYVEHVAQKIAIVKSLTSKEIQKQTLANAQKVFKV
ncbi:TatD family hydrolase [Patescibacteria group bacterium]|nr:TatD family hydrolase [Patescibacteria group bacterium]